MHRRIWRVPQLSRSTEYPINESTSKREEIPVKRKLSLLTLMFMILSALLTACGGTTEPAAAPAAAPAQEPESAVEGAPGAGEEPDAGTPEAVSAAGNEA